METPRLIQENHLLQRIIVPMHYGQSLLSGQISFFFFFFLNKNVKFVKYNIHKEVYENITRALYLGQELERFNSP